MLWVVLACATAALLPLAGVRLLLLTSLAALLIPLILLASICRFVIHIVPFGLIGHIGHYDISCASVASSVMPDAADSY